MVKINPILKMNGRYVHRLIARLIAATLFSSIERNHASPFAEWIGKPVILQVKVENSRSALSGTIIDDALEALHFQPQNGRRTLVIPKACVLAVEEAPRLKDHRSGRRRWGMPLAS